MGSGWGTVGEHPALSCVGGLDAVLDRLAEANLWALSPAELRRLRVGLEQTRARLDAAALRVTHEIDAGGAAVPTGAASTAGWLRHATRADPRVATGEVKLAAELAGPLAATGAALAAGRIGLGHARVIRASLGGLPARTPAEARAAGQDWLIEAATRFDPQALARLARHLATRLDPDGEADLAAHEADLHAARSFTLHHGHDGAGHLRGLLEPETTGLLDAALAALAAPAPAGPDGAGDPRTPAQRRADGLAELIRLALAHPDMPTLGGEPVTLFLTAPATLLTRTPDTPDAPDAPAPGAPGAELEDGTPVSAETLRRLACDAALVAVLLGQHGQVLTLGRTRREPSRALRRALLVRDRGCAFPGCGRPARWTQTHHIVHWARGGRTDPTNLVLLCAHHHRVIHHDGWSVRIDHHGLPVFRPPRWIDPDQTERPAHHTTRQQALHDLPLRS